MKLVLTVFFDFSLRGPLAVIALPDRSAYMRRICALCLSRGSLLPGGGARTQLLVALAHAENDTLCDTVHQAGEALILYLALHAVLLL